jgi:hypothetical protein
MAKAHIPTETVNCHCGETGQYPTYWTRTWNLKTGVHMSGCSECDQRIRTACGVPGLTMAALPSLKAALAVLATN